MPTGRAPRPFDSENANQRPRERALPIEVEEAHLHAGALLRDIEETELHAIETCNRIVRAHLCPLHFLREIEAGELPTDKGARTGVGHERRLRADQTAFRKVHQEVRQQRPTPSITTHAGIDQPRHAD